MKKILKITLVTLTLVSVILLTSVNCFAYYQDELASYGSITYDAADSSGQYIATMSIPFAVDMSKPYYSRYINGANKNWISYNTRDDYADIRCILPAPGMNGYVSSAFYGRLDFVLDYSGTTLSRSSYDGFLFQFPNAGGDTELECIVTVYDTSNSNAIVDVLQYSSVYDYSISRDEIPRLTEYLNSPFAATYSYTFEITLEYPETYEISDFSFYLPMFYRYSPLGNNDSYDEIYDKGYDEGYDEGYELGVNVSEDPVGLRALFSAVQSFLNLEIFPGVHLSLILECLFALLIVSIISKLVAGG